MLFLLRNLMRIPQQNHKCTVYVNVHFSINTRAPVAQLLVCFKYMSVYIELKQIDFESLAPNVSIFDYSGQWMN